MGIWAVLTPPGAAPTAADHDRAIFVRQGFSVPAFLFGPLWILWRRAWLVLPVWIAGLAALVGLEQLLPGSSAATVPLYWLWFAVSANDLVEWDLSVRGWRIAGIVHAASLDLAEKRYFERADGGTTARTAAERPLAARAPVGGQPSGLPSVIGFPEARA